MIRSSLLLLLAALPATAATASFDPVPPDGKESSGLLIRVVQYEGSVNGGMTVEVKNPGAKPADFAANGLFFVPAVDADHAPQRLGAVGPFQVTGKGDRADKLSIAAGASQKLTLDVYCIDSHRSSPTSATPFRVSKERMPKQLVQTIDTSAREAAKDLGGVSATPAKGAVQSQVWKSRNEKWIHLDGEGKQEAGK